MKENIEQRESDAFDRLVAAKPQTAEHRSDDFIAAAIAQSDSLDAKPTTRRLRTRGLTIASATGALAVIALTATTGQWMASSPGHKPLFTAVPGAAASSNPSTDSVAIYRLSIFKFEPGPELDASPSSGPVFSEIPAQNIEKLTSGLFDLAGATAGNYSRETHTVGPNTYTEFATIISENPVDQLKAGSQRYTFLNIGQDAGSTTFSFEANHVDATRSIKSFADAESAVADFIEGVGLTSTTADSVPDGTYKLGIDPSWSPGDSDIRISATLFANQQPTSVHMTFLWGAKTGQLSAAWGALATLELKGTFDTVSEKDAMSRIAQPDREYARTGLPIKHWSARTYWGMSANLFESVLNCVDAKSIYRRTPKAPCTLPIEEKDGEKMPIVTSVAKQASPAMLEIVSSAGTRWLVPGFDYFDNNGYLGSGQSLSDALVAYPNEYPGSD
jgi:hypothetical protein